MILGAIALAVYSFIVCQLIMHVRWSTLAATDAATAPWLTVAMGFEWVLLG